MNKEYLMCFFLQTDIKFKWYQKNCLHINYLCNKNTIDNEIKRWKSIMQGKNIKAKKILMDNIIEDIINLNNDIDSYSEFMTEKSFYDSKEVESLYDEISNRCIDLIGIYEDK